MYQRLYDKTGADGNNDDDDEDNESLRQKILIKVKSYSSQKRNKSDDFDLLGWWKDNENHYPYVAKTAKHYLCIPATSVTSERAFSTANNIVTKTRNCLDPKNVEILTFLKNNDDYIPKETNILDPDPDDENLIEKL